MQELDALNPFASYEFDACVATFAVIIKNALQETVETGAGSDKRHVAKYKLADLLRDDFTFGQDRPSAPLPTGDGAAYDEVT